MSTNSVLTPCKARCGTFTLLHGLGNENELLTHTKQGAVLSRYSMTHQKQNVNPTHLSLTIFAIEPKKI